MRVKGVFWDCLRPPKSCLSVVHIEVLVVHQAASYPPSPAHFAYLMSTLTINDQLESPIGTLEQAPSLVILIELSAYFLSDIQANPSELQSFRRGIE